MPFASLNLAPEIIKALAESGYTKPTPIQETAIPKMLEGCDIFASAQTGSGKTAAFLLPALNLINKPAKTKSTGPRVLILVPTRELAMQVATQAVKYSQHMSRVRTVCIYGGAPYPVQNKQLARPYEILVATPGRLIDHVERGRIDFSGVELFVLDEADRMLDMGFIQPVEHIASQLPADVQTVLFSATLEGNILRLSKNLLENPFQINLAADTKKHENIEQILYFADNLDHKLRLLDRLLEDNKEQQTIIFTSTKVFAGELASILREQGQAVGVLHGDLDQRRRTSTIRQLREGQISVLVATDVAARGIDIPTISLVINFDLPANIEDYVHRIGRTGRAEAKGVAIAFALSRDRYLVEKIDRLTDSGVKIQTIPGLEPTMREQAGRRPRRGGFQHRGGGGGGGGQRRSEQSGESRAPRFDRSEQPASGSRFGRSEQPASGSRFGRSEQPASGSRFGRSEQPSSGSRFGRKKPSNADRPRRSSRFD